MEQGEVMKLLKFLLAVFLGGGTLLFLINLLFL